MIKPGVWCSNRAHWDAVVKMPALNQQRLQISLLVYPFLRQAYPLLRRSLSEGALASDDVPPLRSPLELPRNGLLERLAAGQHSRRHAPACTASRAPPANEHALTEQVEPGIELIPAPGGGVLQPVEFCYHDCT